MADHQHWERALEVVKTDVPRRHVYGWLSKVVEKDGTPVVDRQGDIIPVDELEQAAKQFMLDSRQSDVMHDTNSVGDVFESFVSTPEKRAAQGYGDPTDQTVGWWVGVEVPPDVFKRVQTGELRAFSIGGAAIREPQ